MHEMSIAGAVLASVRRHAGGRPVSRVRVRVGHLRQVVPDSLGFAWRLIRADSVADGAELEIEHVRAAVSCGRCEQVTEQSGFPLVCGGCGSLDLQVVRGNELEIEWIEVESAPGARTRRPRRGGRMRKEREESGTGART